MTFKRSASQSKSIAPIGSNWHSVCIEWSNKAGGILRFPYPEFVIPKDFHHKSFISEVSLKEIDDQGLPRPLPSFDSIRAAKAKKPKEEIVLGYSVLPERHIAVASTTAVAQKNTDSILKMNRASEGLLCTEAKQWVSITVTCKTPSAKCPAIHVWSFLQPPKIANHSKLLAGFHEMVPDDFPRSGWGEYLLSEGGKTCTRRTWSEGKLKEERVESSEFLVEQESPAVWILRLNISIRNDMTPGDLARMNKRKGPPRPQDDCEAGCWLKVWARDPDAGWDLEPADDETEDLPKRMAAQDAEYCPIDFSAKQGTSLGAHAFLRGRLLRDGKKAKYDIKDASPVYAMLFTPDAMGKLVELDKLLNPPEKSRTRQMGSIVTVTAASFIVVFLLRKVLKAWQDKTKGTRPAGIPEDVTWPDDANRDKADVFVKLVEALDLAPFLAAYAADGFEHASPMDVMAAAKSQENIVKIMTLVYGQMFDMAFAQGPSHYKEYLASRKESREKMLSRLIDGAQSAATEPKDPQAKAKADQARKEKQAYEKASLGLGMQAKGALSKSKLAIDKEQVKFSFKLLEGQHKESFPKPAGAPLPIAGIPLVWRFDYEHGGEAQLEFGMVLPKENGEWEFSIVLSGNGKVKSSLGIHALWSGLLDPEKVAQAAELKSEWKIKTGKSTKAQEIEKTKSALGQDQQALLDMRNDALANPPDPVFRLLRLLKELNQVVRLDAVVTAGLNLNAGIGIKFKGNSKTGAGRWVFTGNDALSELAMTADLNAQLQVSLLSLDYPIAVMPQLATINTQCMAVNLSGSLLGRSWDGLKKDYAWGQGSLDNLIVFKDGRDFLVWGRVKELEQSFKNLDSPEVKYDLLRTASDTAPVVSELPKEAATASQNGADGKITIQLQLTSRSSAAKPHQVAVGGLGTTKDNFKIAGTGLGGNDSDAKNFLQELNSGKGSANLVLRSKWLLKPDRMSAPIRVLSPVVHHQGLSAARGILKIDLVLGCFEDDVLWLQLRESNHLGDSVLRNQKQEWLLVHLQGIVPHAQGRKALVQTALNQLEFPFIKEDVWEIYPVLSLVPDACGVINKNWFPRNPDDSSRLLRVKT